MTDHVVRSVTVDVDAPASFVWDVLVDYERYPEWNPFTVAASTTLQVGDPIDLTLPDMTDGSKTMAQREWIERVEPPHLLVYGMPATPELDVAARRDQVLEETGPESCRYWTSDTFTGPLADSVLQYTGQWVKDGFDSVAHALKARAEKLWVERQD